MPRPKGRSSIRPTPSSRSSWGPLHTVTAIAAWLAWRTSSPRARTVALLPFVLQTFLDAAWSPDIFRRAESGPRSRRDGRASDRLRGHHGHVPEYRAHGSGDARAVPRSGRIRDRPQRRDRRARPTSRGVMHTLPCRKVTPWRDRIQRNQLVAHQASPAVVRASTLPRHRHKFIQFSKYLGRHRGQGSVNPRWRLTVLPTPAKTRNTPVAIVAFSALHCPGPTLQLLCRELSRHCAGDPDSELLNDYVALFGTAYSWSKPSSFHAINATRIVIAKTR